MDMMGRTHLVIALFFGLLFLGSMGNLQNKIIFSIVVLIAAVLPDIDSTNSKVGRYKVLRFLQVFVRHRGMMHSFTICIIISVLFAIFAPLLAFPFFLGYGLHLLADSMTLEGIQPFWPSSKTVNGWMQTGRHAEKVVFFVFIGLSVFALFVKFL